MMGWPIFLLSGLVEIDMHKIEITNFLLIYNDTLADPSTKMGRTGFLIAQSKIT